MFKPILIFIFFLALLLHPSYTIKLQLPVSQVTLVKTILSIDKLQQLLMFFNTQLQDKNEIYNRVQLTKSYLLDIMDQLALTNNVISGIFNGVKGTNNLVDGSLNTIYGNKNIVFGNFNSVQGSNNWVLASGFNGKINGVLLVGQFVVDLQKSYLILKSPRLGISYIDQQRNIDLKNTYTTDQRQLAIWKDLSLSNNQEADKYWGRYVGYMEWKVFSEDRKNLRVDLEELKGGSSGSVNIISGWKESSAKLALNSNSWIDFFKFSTSGGANVANANTGTTQTIVTAKNFIKPITSKNTISTVLDSKWVVGLRPTLFGN